MKHILKKALYGLILMVLPTNSYDLYVVNGSSHAEVSATIGDQEIVLKPTSYEKIKMPEIFRKVEWKSQHASPDSAKIEAPLSRRGDTIAAIAIEEDLVPKKLIAPYSPETLEYALNDLASK